ncbi:MAG: ATP-binding cassette domain-containing protein, partial [Rectinema sp.]
MTMRMHEVRKSFEALRVLDGIDADFPESSVTAILGPSGCGKTTLLNIAAGLITPDSGEIEGFPGSTFSYAFQDPRLLPWLDTKANILFALSGLPDASFRAERADRYLAASGLSAFAASKPPELSGGMRQRLSLARAFAFPSRVLLLDEAFSSVDLKIRIDLMDLFSRLWDEERRTTLMVT